MDRDNAQPQTAFNTATHIPRGYHSVPTQGIDEHTPYETVHFQTAGLEDKRTTELKHDPASDNDGTALHIERHKLGFFAILNDCAMVTIPIAFIVFASVVLSLDGKTVVEGEHARWTNAIAVVGDPGFLGRDSGGTMLKNLPACHFVPDPVRSNRWTLAVWGCPMETRTGSNAWNARAAPWKSNRRSYINHSS